MEIKEKIIRRIYAIDDPVILGEIYRLLSLEPEMEVYEMTDEERQGVEQGIRDFENGRWFTEEEADNIYKKWRKKRLDGL